MQKFNDIYAQFLELCKTESFFEAYTDNTTVEMVLDFKKYKTYLEEEKLCDNSLFVSKLHDKYIDLSFQVFSFSVGEHLKNLFTLFERAYPDSARQIKKYWDVYSFSKGNKHILLKGDIQSGKTAMMILTALCYLVCDRDVVILLRTSNDDKNQFIDRFQEIVNAIRELGYTNKNFQTMDVGDKSSSPQGNTKCCFVSIYCAGKKGGYIKKLQNILQSRGNNFVMYVDEADQRDDHKDTEFIKLRGICSTSIFVSGTVQDILVSNFDIKGRNLVELTPNSSYKGVNDINWITRWDNSTEDGVYWSLCDIANDSWPSEYSYHPKLILITTSTKIKFLTKYYKKFQNTDNFLDGYPLPEPLKNLCVIKYGDKGLRLYHESFCEQNFEEETFQPIHNGCELTFGSKSGMSIKKVLLWLARNGGKARFPTIVIMAGKKADRGINFACYDSFDPRNNWHITHQILHKLSIRNTETSQNGATKSAVLLQSLRILGNFSDDIPLKVYTSEKEKKIIMNAYNLTNKLYSCITNENDEFYMNEYKKLTTDDICKKIPIKKRSIDSNFIKKSIRASFNLVADHEQGICTSNLESSTRTLQILSNDEVEEMARKIRIWFYDEPNRKISKVLQDIKIGMEYTKAEIEHIMIKHSLSTQNLVHLLYFKVNNTNGYGKILRINNNGKYQIYPQLENIFTETFMNKD